MFAWYLLNFSISLKIKFGLANLTGTGTLVADALETDMYVKVSGSWDDSQPFVKHEGAWKEPVIYIKVSGAWKKVYRKGT